MVSLILVAGKQSSDTTTFMEQKYVSSFLTQTTISLFHPPLMTCQQYRLCIYQKTKNAPHAQISKSIYQVMVLHGVHRFRLLV